MLETWVDKIRTNDPNQVASLYQIRSEDDLTHKLVDIIRVNQRLKESKEAGTPPLIVQDLVDLLQYHVSY